MAKRIVFLSEFESVHGGENSLLVLLPFLKKNGISPIVVAPPTGDFADAVRRLDIDLIGFRRAGQQGETVSKEAAREMLAELLRYINPDLVHANSLSMGRLSGPVCSHLCIPGVSHLRDIIRLNRQAIDDLNCNQCLLAVSHATRNYHVTQGVLSEKCHVLYNGVDSARFQFRPRTGFLHQELKLPDNAFLLGNVGQICLRKGHNTLFEAMSELFPTFPNAHLLVIGKRWSSKAESIAYEDQLKNLALQSPLKGRVHFLGVRHDIPAILNELTLLMHTARQEPLGRVLLEAAASQLPVVATDVGGTNEIFASLEPSTEPAAALVPKDDTASLVSTITELLLNETMRHNLAVSARHIIEKRFSIEQAVTQLTAHYEASIPEPV